MIINIHSLYDKIELLRTGMFINPNKKGGMKYGNI